MKKWRWVALDVLHAVHDSQLAEHGGLSGVRDAGAIESAIARPLNRIAYEEKSDAAALAAAYAYGLARSHEFADGNKRVAWIAARLFLLDNGYRFDFEPLEAIRMMEAVAAGAIAEDDLGEWFRQRIKRVRGKQALSLRAQS